MADVLPTSFDAMGGSVVCGRVGNVEEGECVRAGAAEELASGVGRQGAGVAREGGSSTQPNNPTSPEPIVGPQLLTLSRHMRVCPFGTEQEGDGIPKDHPGAARHREAQLRG